MSQSGLASSGIAGLDDILLGGLPRNHIYLVEGDPGGGKTTLALQFLLAGARQGERCLYIALSETQEDVRLVAASHGWDLSALQIHTVSPFEQSLQSDSANTLFVPSDVELHEAMRALLSHIEEVRPARIVFDSLSELRLLAQDALRYRRQLLTIKEYFAGRSCTVLLLDDRTIARDDRQLHSLSHGVISLSQQAPEYGVERRLLRVVKLRGVNFRSGQHDFVIRHGGLVVFPRLVAAEHQSDFLPGLLKSGVLELDRLLGGGIDYGTSTLVIGPAGSGKSNLTTRYLLAAAEQGESAVVFHFDENLSAMRRRALGLGMALDAHLDSGRISAQRIDSSELSPGALDSLVRQYVEERHVRVLVLDSLNGYRRAVPDERTLSMQLQELLHYLAQKGVCSFIILSQPELLGSVLAPAEVAAPTGVASMTDAVILLRSFESHGVVQKALSVLKRRGGAHDSTLHRLSFGPQGLVLGELLRESAGASTASPSYAAPGARKSKSEPEHDGHAKR